MRLNKKFDCEISNYTISVAPEDMQAHRYVEDMKSKRMFAAFAKIKSDLSNKKKPKIKSNDIKYFYHDFTNDFFADEIFCIDIKSAYANVLLSEKLISKETFDYLSKLEKKDRLASLGMLASKKRLYRFDGKNYRFIHETENPLSNFFYYAAKKTFELMSELKKICGNAYLFTWVDCIYFINDEDIMSECLCYLENILFPYSAECLRNFKVKRDERFIRVTYYKENTKKEILLPIKKINATRIETNLIVK